MTRNRTIMSILGFVVAWGGLSAQSTVIGNYYNRGYQVGQTVSQGGLVTSSYYDPYGQGYQFPSPQFPSTQFPSVSTPSASIRGAFGPGPYGTTVSTYGTAAYAAPGTPPVAYASPTGGATPYIPGPPTINVPYGANPYAAGYPPVTYAAPAVAGAVPSPVAPVFNPAPVAPYTPYTPIAPLTPLPPARAAYPTGAYSSLGGPTVGTYGGAAPAIQQIYPQPAFPGAPIGGQPHVAPQLVIRQLPLEFVQPLERYTPGLATIKDGRWSVSDMFYNLPPNIAVKVNIVKPQNQYTPISETQIEKQIREIFTRHFIFPDALAIPCQPASPVFQVTLLVYPCDRRCVGAVTAQLYETAHPKRMDAPINGVWQVISWQRQAVVASACEEFEQEIAKTVAGMATEFGRIFQYYHQIAHRPCFDSEDYPIWMRDGGVH